MHQDSSCALSRPRADRSIGLPRSVHSGLSRQPDKAVVRWKSHLARWQSEQASDRLLSRIVGRLPIKIRPGMLNQRPAISIAVDLQTAGIRRDRIHQKDDVDIWTVAIGADKGRIRGMLRARRSARHYAYKNKQADKSKRGAPPVWPDARTRKPGMQSNAYSLNERISMPI